MEKGFNIVIGAQAGSEAKGKLSAFIAQERPGPDLVCMASSPNAGHTYVDGNGIAHVTYHLPAAAVVTQCPIVLGPSSLINAATFIAEVDKLRIDPGRVYISHRASRITPEHCSNEAGCGLSDIGSTLQGVGEARCHKMRRDGTVQFVGDDEQFAATGFNVCDTESMINGYLSDGARVLYEMTQGFDLCLEHGIHPRYCTSKMITPAMAMAEAGVNPHFLAEIYGVLRPYPIRVNNRTGTSGPYTGAQEITWADVARECGYTDDVGAFGEYTTTTKLPRRVFTFSWERFRYFCAVCGPTRLCLQFANYINWYDFGVNSWDRLSASTRSFIQELEEEAGCPVTYVGTGPRNDQMVVVPPVAG
jgi:adenylosuccinate synthase